MTDKTNMTAPVDVLAVLGRHVSLAEQVACLEQQAEAHAVFDAVAELIEAARGIDRDSLGHPYVDADRCPDCVAINRLDAALHACGGAE